jgi:hypothetical protein
MRCLLVLRGLEREEGFVWGSFAGPSFLPQEHQSIRYTNKLLGRNKNPRKELFQDLATITEPLLLCPHLLLDVLKTKMAEIGFAPEVDRDNNIEPGTKTNPWRTIPAMIKREMS